MDDLLYREEVYRIIGACLTVHKDKANVKAAKCLTDEHRAQLLNYLRVTGLQLGLLVNFGSFPRLEWERIVLTRS
jgi:hypothetical protein